MSVEVLFLKHHCCWCCCFCSIPKSNYWHVIGLKIKRLLLRCLQHFKSDSINNMYHIRISGNEPSSVILSQKGFVSKVGKWCTKSAKTSWSQKGWCNKPTKLQFQSFLKRKILMLSKRYESTEVDRRTWLHVPSGTHWSISSDTHQVVEI